jgi:tagaturonate reductase
LPERVLQFGEGNFLRAFVDWMLGRMNRRGSFDGRAVLVQPIASGMADAINAQDGLYTVVLRGLQHGEAVETTELVTSVSRALNPYADYDAFLACARNPDLRFVISNTTEAGIRTDAGDRLDARPAASFPGKLVQLLYARFRHFGGDTARGLFVMPCELIENNGDALVRACQETAERFELPPDFMRFLTESCTFTNTLVDRIVTGYPRDEASVLGERLGYEDRLLVAGELFHSWVIEARGSLEAELPLRQAGLNVTWTDDVRPYRERKVRILNGAHTMTALAAFLAGMNTVGECMADPLFSAFVERGVHDEILPTLELPRHELLEFADAVVERFRNPFIEHQLLSIALNSVSKYRARILGTVADHTRAQGRLPPRLSFAMAALIAFYRGREIAGGALIGERTGVVYRIQDDAQVLDFFRDAWQAAGSRPDREACAALVGRVLAREDFWSDDLNVALPGYANVVAEHLHGITNLGVRAALERVSRL